MPAGLIARFRPAGPWRFGPDSGARDRVKRVCHSDTLYSAVTAAMLRLGSLDEWLDATARAASPAVRFTSCFPSIGETLLLPPPANLWPPAASSKVRWRGARFVSVEMVEQLIAEQPVAEDRWAVDGASECLIPAGARGPFRAILRRAAAVDRLGSGVEPHATACLEFTDMGGMWAAAEFAGDAARDRWMETVKSALRLLADSGIGGERSRGWGRSEPPVFTEGELPGLLIKPKPPAPPADAEAPPPPAPETAWWLLSLFNPSAEDSIDWTRGAYSLITRGGRVDSPARSGDPKKTLEMVREGSVLLGARAPAGTARDVAPDGFPHPVFRAGFAFSIAIPWRVVL